MLSYIELFQVDTGGTVTRPTHMALPDDVIDLNGLSIIVKQVPLLKIYLKQ